MRDIPALELNDVHLLFEGKRLRSLKSDKSLFTQLSFFLNCIHVHCCQLKPTYSLKELLPFINSTKLDFLDDIFTLSICRKKL